MSSLLNTLTALCLAAATVVSAQSIVQVNNYCTQPHWITVMNGTYFVSGNGTWELKGSWAYQTPIQGKGNTLGVTATNEYWTSATPKLILGYTADEGQIWWSVSSLDGAPFPEDHFNVTSPSSISGLESVCGTAMGYEAQNHNCTDTGDVVVTLNLCFETA
ncbi:hypothetical protein Slin15195_G000950 [Septoria linicola]|uniref:Uncharacterized protein n=1 Tax=Septoria linicola TaxID=215465 RepID=A0A9Q9AIZ3_9PEZI|nr:hypothetical protein Slin15195_G000950 [Septoria linicola]